MAKFDKKKLPTINYELSLEARRVEGEDFFCCLTFPYKKTHASFVLGLPYEVYPPQSQCREVILVGHCGMLEDTVQYFNSLYYFCKIYQTLEAAGIKVFYRPHPQDDIEFVRSIFPNVPITEKSELLASNRKIFIGFG